jgi:hypothetical protein
LGTYFRTGFENNEHCVLEVSGDLDIETARELLFCGNNDVEEHIQADRFKIISF